MLLTCLVSSYKCRYTILFTLSFQFCIRIETLGFVQIFNVETTLLALFLLLVFCFTPIGLASISSFSYLDYRGLGVANTVCRGCVYCPVGQQYTRIHHYQFRWADLQRHGGATGASRARRSAVPCALGHVCDCVPGGSTLLR